MKTIVEFINESLNKAAYGVFASWTDEWRDYLNGETDWDEIVEYLNDEYDIDKPVVLNSIKNVLDDIKKHLVDCGTTFLGNWGEGYYDSMSEAWSYFYHETGCKKNNICLAFFQDGDDGQYYFVELKPNTDQKLIEDFKTLFNEDVWWEQN